MLFSEETYRAVIVAAIHSQGQAEDIGAVIREAAGGLLAACREIVSSDLNPSATHPQDADKT